jgi:hypothetical protein
VQSLAHFGATVADEHGTININVHKGASLIQEFSREGDTVFSWQNTNAFLLISVFPEFCIRKVLK